MTWYARPKDRDVSVILAKDYWRAFDRPKYPFHSAVAKEYGAALPLGDYVVIVKEGLDGEERSFLVSNITTTYVRPLDDPK